VVVIDASIVLEWLLVDARSAEAEAILVRMASEEFWVPALFWLEVGNVLRSRIKRGRLDIAVRDALLARTRALGLRTDQMADPSGAGLGRCIALSDRFDLTAYDAAYLELALRLGADMGTFDADLAAAATNAGATVLGGPARP
jgi:predicted nucleic acid-binding protein